MARLKLLTIDELTERGIDVAPFRKDFAELPGSVATLGYRPDILAATLQLWTAVMDGGTLTPQLKYLAGYMASMAAGCRYCSAHTASNAARMGGDDAKVAAVFDFETSPLFDDRERAALRFAMLAGQSPSGVGDADMAVLKAHFDPPQIVELLAVVSLYGFFNRWNDSLAMPLEATPRGFAESTLVAHGWEIGAHG